MTNPDFSDGVSLTALVLTVLLFCVIDGGIVLALAAKEKSLIAGIGMFVLHGGPLSFLFGGSVYRWLKNQVD